MTTILGPNAYHGDSSACLVKDGALVAAAEEERLRRIKHWAGFPWESIRYCLAEAGIRLRDVDVAAVNQDAGANLWKKLYVQSAAGDAGGAIGAAFVVWQQLKGGDSSPLAGGEEPRSKRFVMDHAYWGPGFSNRAGPT